MAFSKIRIAVIAIVLFVFLRFLVLPSSPTILHHEAGVNFNTTAIPETYDYIVVGGGQSGLTVANRLSEGKDTVLVVEDGYLYHDDPLIARPFQPFDANKGLYHDPKLMYNYSSTPQAGLNNRRLPVSAANTFGGGSTVNGMFFNRGAAEDYDAWETLGNPGWGWKGILPYFKKSVTFTPPGKWLQEEFGATYDIDAYGGSGPIHASNPAWAWPGQSMAILTYGEWAMKVLILVENQIAGLKELGIKQSLEGAGGNAYGVFWVPRAQHPANQTRSYAVTGHLDRALRHHNFDALPGHHVTQILFSKELRAEGVVIQRRNGTGVSVVYARKEIILAAGGLHSPAILQRSGIGPRHILEAAGVDVRVELPGVGMNFQDHPAAGMLYKFETDLPQTPAVLNDATVSARFQAEFDTNRTGPFSGGHNTVLFLPGRDFWPKANQFIPWVTGQSPIQKFSQFLPAAYNNDETLLAGYDKQAQILGQAFASPKSALIEMPLAADSYALLILQKPLSRGTIIIDPADPMGDPLVDYGTFTHPLDLDMLVNMMHYTRKWYATNAMKVLSPLEVSPGAAMVKDEELGNFIRQFAESTIGHQSGSCSMMPLESGGVVGPDLLVYGVKGLSVVDASMIPLVPSTNLCATVYAVAEKAADLIKRRHGS